MNYKRLQNTARNLIGRFDQRDPKIKVVFRRNGSIDPLTGDYQEIGTEKPNFVNAVVLRYTDEQIDGTIIQRGDIRLVLDDRVAPQIGDSCIIDGLEYSILEPIIAYNPGGVVLGWEIQCRR